ncbi:NUDIX domain-containing protein [Arcanobacterium haemolyticum]|nr:NUDIX domain-containing protein [Arcanobacterium haemolyticum]
MDKETRADVESEWTPDADGILSREAARIVIFRPDGATYLIYGHDIDDTDHAWWFTVGGGYGGDETPRQGACRELYEETGLVVSPDRLVGPVLDRHATFYFASETRRQHEYFFLLFLDNDEAARVGEHRELTDLEQEVLDEYRWWQPEEIPAEEAQGTAFYPAEFAGRARSWRDGWDGQLEEIWEN